MLEKTLAIKKERTLKVKGRNVKFIEYEDDTEGDFVKVCTYDHRLGVSAEYAWINKKYKNADILSQTLTKIIINGNKVECDILDILTEDCEEYKKIYFDISQMMEEVLTIKKENWEEKAKIIYETLIQDFGFSVSDKDEENLFKKINENISIGFDITYFFGYVVHGDKLDKKMIKKYKKTLDKYISNGFIGKEIWAYEYIVGGHIKIDDLDDINVVFENYRSLEKECREINNLKQS